jgi:hypothetical protein
MQEGSVRKGKPSNAEDVSGFESRVSGSADLSTFKKRGSNPRPQIQNLTLRSWFRIRNSCWH